MSKSHDMRLAGALSLLMIAPSGPALAVGPAADPAAIEAAQAMMDLSSAIATMPAADREAVAGFYAARGDAPFWLEPGADRAGALRAALATATAHGLPADRYDVAGLEAQVGPASSEIAAMALYLRWARDLGAGIVAPSAVDPEIDIAPAAPTAAAALARLDDGPVAAALAGLEPQDPDYRRLMDELARLSGAVRSGGWGPRIAEGDTLHRGDVDPRVATLRQRLTTLGYPAEAADGGATYYDPGLERAVMNFQRDAGLVDDGAAGRRTLAQINAEPEDRIAQVVVNLERLRWGEDDGGRRIVANIPDYTVRLSDGGTVLWESRAVVGKADDTRTPEFVDEMTYMVVNPTWHVPKSISTRIYLPKLQKDPGIFHRQGMQLFTRSGAEVNPRLVDFQAFTVENFPFLIKQKPSDDNALGLVKFMFPNQHAIYLHDTPSRDLFARDGRAFSNGCVRLERPYDLAHALLEGQVADPDAAFTGWVAARKERRVDLDRPVPVSIVYRTAFGDDEGVIRYREDVYGRDATVFRALQDAGVTVNTAQG